MEGRIIQPMVFSHFSQIQVDHIIQQADIPPCIIILMDGKIQLRGLDHFIITLLGIQIRPMVRQPCF